ncbi:MAG: BPL-N domain-containing protein [Simkaniaceae bacterium]|nr:BPL-N domain-containing protein [Candidatus Sacchlamyda saccharinae]
MPAIKTVVIYTNTSGVYADNCAKRVKMFNELNPYREMMGRPKWIVKESTGDDLIKTLSAERPEDTLLVIPAGQSSLLDRVFTATQLTFLKEEFFQNGGRAYLNCGSAYWTTSKRIYHGVCDVQPENPVTMKKDSVLPLLEGIAEGPLCPYPASKYRVGFFSDAMEVTDGSEKCTVYLSGGGCFTLDEETKETQKVLVRYQHEELSRHGKDTSWENAAVLTSVGKGAALLSMFHEYYGPDDIDTALYQRVFPDSGSDWKAIHDRLSSIDDRMNFVLKSMLHPLEDLDVSQPKPPT